MTAAWLTPELILTQSSATSRDEVVSLAAAAIASATQGDAEELARLFGEALSGEGFSMGQGVAIPHVEVPGATRTHVCLVTTRAPVALPTLDGRPPDVFFFVAAQRDPRAHLLLLAHIARLAQSRTFVDGLRAATSAEEVVALVDAAVQRQSALPPLPAAAVPAVVKTEALLLLVASGEKLVDSILMDLVNRGFDDGCILEAQSLGEAAAHEVPLFAGFRDIFGDPGGRRVLLVRASADDVDTIAGAVRRMCDEHRSPDAQLYVLPLQSHWTSRAVPEPEPPPGH